MMGSFRVFFSILWFISTGCVFAGGLVFIVTLGGYAPFFYWSLGIWVVATFGAIITSLE